MMNRKIILLFFIVFVSCKAKRMTSNLLQGYWKGTYLNTKVELQINDSEFIEIVDRGDGKLETKWDYEMLNDTLVLKRANNYIRKHIVLSLSENKLEFKPLVMNQVDISLIESITFKKE